MTRKLGWFVLVVAFGATISLPAEAAKVSGYVKNTDGVPQMGAAVEILTGAVKTARTVYTNDRGFFAVSDLKPGTYNVKVTAPSFLPTLRENVNLQSNASIVLNLTLNTLFEAISLFPERKKANDDQDDWKWTLRSISSRPVLRVVHGDPLIVAQTHKDAVRAKLAFVAGSRSAGFGAGGDYGTAFQVDQSIFTTGMLSFTGNLAYGEGGEPAGTVRAAYSRELPNGSRPEFAVTMRRFGSGLAPQNLILQSVEASASNRTMVGSAVELEYGAALQTIQFVGREHAFRPYATMDWHLSPNTVVEYRYATSLPNMRLMKGFDTAPADFTEANPRVTLSGGMGRVESASHHEVSLSQRLGTNSVQLALFADRINNASLTGVGRPQDGLNGILPDVFSGTFSYNGGAFSARGMRIVFERNLPGEISATVDYAFGGVLDVEGRNISWEDVSKALYSHETHQITAKVAGKLPATRARWLASYGWTNGTALTPVDMFNASPGQAEPYVNVFIRQPLPHSRFVPGKMEAIVDVRNLLAQGYVPVVTQDGSTVYLVQSARSVRGGVAFTF